MQKTKSGFTIVELLIVIVVIAILATISVVAYNGIQDRALATHRINDMTTIAKALELYKSEKGHYPDEQSNSTGGWEISAVNPDNFLIALKSDGILNKVPVDPINTAPEGPMGPQGTFTTYAYYLYPAGTFADSGCPSSYGEIYALKVLHPGKPRIDEAPGLRCGGVAIYSGGQVGTPYITGGTTN